MLVRPFIQPISAFNALTESGIAIIGILGGDKVEKINYKIYHENTLILSSQITVNDIGGDKAADVGDMFIVNKFIQIPIEE